MPRALILGATGQDGQFIADFLVGKGYEVVGVSRAKKPFNTNPLGLRRPSFKSVDIRRVLELSNLIMEFEPNEIYNLAGESSVSRSFEDPTQTIESNVVGLVNLLTVLVNNPKLHSTKVFQASSAEMFGSSNEPLNENSPFKPVSPYSISKLAAHKICNSYRENFGLWISCGILFNHESELRPETFVFQKIITSALAISRKEASSMTLGNLEISRDWGYSKEYVEAMWLILQADNPKDYVVATGTSHSLRDLIELVFTNLQIKGSVDEFIKIDPSFTRPTDVESTVGDPRRIETDLGWKAKTSFEELVDILVRHQLKDSL
jgi:GDPmannose 4,6-dehydratase